jgi:chloramphenicol-sensitive protein RarD
MDQRTALKHRAEWTEHQSTIPFVDPAATPPGRGFVLGKEPACAFCSLTMDRAASPPRRIGVSLTEHRRGLLYGVAAYGMWGLIPIYFKAVSSVPALEVLAHRVVWSAAMLLLFVIVRGRAQEAGGVLRDRRTLVTLLLSTALIATNWFLFIWAVAHDRILEASLGYFINPLVNVLLGTVFLGERLSPSARVAVVLAAVGVAIQVVIVGAPPWIALTLAFSFGLYGLLRKTARVGSVIGLTIETSLLAPIAVGFLVWVERSGALSFGSHDLRTDVLLLLAGAVTALPLLFFTGAARRLPLATLGFLQYLAPTGQFLLAVLAYGEPLTAAHLATFGCIWTALAVFTRDQLRVARA